MKCHFSSPKDAVALNICDDLNKYWNRIYLILNLFYLNYTG